MFDLTPEHAEILEVGIKNLDRLCIDERLVIERIERRIISFGDRCKFTTHRERNILARIARKLSRQIERHKLENQVDPEITKAGIEMVRQILNN